MLARIFVLAFVGSVATAHDFAKCPGQADHLGMATITLDPDSPKGGQTLTVTMSGTPDQQITGGTAKLTVKVFGITIATQSFDICKDMGVPCPQASGKAFSGHLSYLIPSAAPGGVSAECEVDVTDPTGNKLGCYTMKVTLSSSSENMFLRVGDGYVASRSRQEIEYLFEAWRRDFDVEFASADEYVRRMDIFAANLQTIESHNAKGLDWTMGANEFMHLTWDEFRATRLGLAPRPDQIIFGDRTRHQYDATSVAAAPDAVDWVSKGAVTPVKNQQQCGSCWAFSTTGSLEGAYFLKHGTLKSFSEQQLVDCDNAQHHGTDQGCNGGLMDNAFKWIEHNGGLCTEADYKYKAKKGKKCKSCSIVSGSAPKTFTDVDSNEGALKTALAQQPVSIAIEADQSGFQFYKSGVFSGKCGQQLDHGVLAVGYGTEGGKDYWKVKNSWGSTWGQKGYILLKRGGGGSTGQCGLLKSASYPTL